MRGEIALEHKEHQGHKGHEGIPTGVEALSGIIVDAGLKVHRTLGPGLLESAYESCLYHELQLRGLTVRRQAQLPFIYEGMILDAGYRIDLIVEESIVVEIKAVEALTRLHRAQVLTYLKLSNLRIGLLLNFNVELFKDGVRRLVL